MSEPNTTAVEIPPLEQLILVVEDEHIFAKAVKKVLQRAGYKVELAGDIKTARADYKNYTPELVLLDMRLPDGSGLDLLTEIKSADNQTSVLVMSAYGELEDAVSAMKLGAADYLKKPIDLNELLINVEKVLDKNKLAQRLAYSAKREQHATDTVEFLGNCAPIQQVKQQINQIAALPPTATIAPTVLILGETGTGKDVTARLLHASSYRKHKPFVHIDCASLPKDLIESELFGHEKGAFTNAHIARTGLIEAAEDGVLFLDEVGEIPLDLQAKLLAVLERRTLRRVGTNQERPVSAWIIAATNRDLEILVEAGKFRSDLYYRLNVMPISIPPLRERGDDILLLANHFAMQISKRYGRVFETFTDAAMAALLTYPWPGNIREMKHLIERAILLNNSGTIHIDLLNFEQKPPKKQAVIADSKDKLSLSEAEILLIKQALERTKRNVSKAAVELGITRMALRYRIKKYNL